MNNHSLSVSPPQLQEQLLIFSGLSLSHPTRSELLRRWQRRQGPSAWSDLLLLAAKSWFPAEDEDDEDVYVVLW